MRSESKKLLKTETDVFYKIYLEQAVADSLSVHGRYFSKDNSEIDDKIKQEVNEIFHDKELLLSLDNHVVLFFLK